MRLRSPEKIKLDPDLSSLFPIKNADVQAIATSMQARGFDSAEPIVIWNDLVVDGHTRLRAAQSIGLKAVYVDDRTFEDKRAALEYAIARQRDRRNLTKAELAGFITKAMEALDRVKPQGRPAKELASTEANLPSTADLWLADQERKRAPKSAAETAEKIGTSRAQVERVRAVLASDLDEVKDLLRDGEMTIAKAYNAVREKAAAVKDSAPAEPIIITDGSFTVEDFAAGVFPDADLIRKEQWSVAEWEGLAHTERVAVLDQAPGLGEHATFNQVNENIDWAKWSWNPVTGCLHNCAYCYARDIAERFFTQGFVPTFMPSRLSAPRHTKVPGRAEQEIGWRNVFVCSMADLFGKWVPQDWIDAVFHEVVSAPQWNFLFLTKFPQRLAEMTWPGNAWCGTSVDAQYRVEIAERSFRGVRAGVKWLSCEPLMERLTFTSLDMFDWVVIGAASKSTQTPEFQPPWEWVEHLLKQAREAGCRVYIKPNLKSRPQEYPLG